jgi:hypothetical protein
MGSMMSFRGTYLNRIEEEVRPCSEAIILTDNEDSDFEGVPAFSNGSKYPVTGRRAQGDAEKF